MPSPRLARHNLDYMQNYNNCPKGFFIVGFRLNNLSIQIPKGKWLPSESKKNHQFSSVFSILVQYFFSGKTEKSVRIWTNISIQFSILNSKTEPKILIKYLYIYICTYVSLTQIVAPNQSPHTRTNEITNRSHQIQSPQKSPSPGKRSIHKPNYSFVPFLHTSYIANNASKSSSKQIYFKFHHQQPRQQKRRKKSLARI